MLVVQASTDAGAAGKSFEVYYSDTAQPVDMYASLQNCKSQGKSVKQCFFGEGFDDSKTINLEDVLSRPLQGSLFSFFILVLKSRGLINDFFSGDLPNSSPLRLRLDAAKFNII